jgi:hypothetical protein
VTRSRQLILFDVDPRPLPVDEDTPVEPVPRDTPVDPRQDSLFADHVVLARGLDEALLAGRFEEAARLRVQLETTFSPSRSTKGLGFLERMDAATWDGPAGEALAAWAEIEAGLTDRALRARVREGVYARLLRRQLADLLAEDHPPIGQASLGVVRRLWPTPPPPTADEVDLHATSVPVSDEDRAAAFWQWLRLADSPGSPDDIRLEARRRMKALDPEMHALYMKKAGRPPTAR